MNNIDPLLTASESAQYLQVSVPTFWRRVADGTVPPAVKIGSLSRWPHSEILEVIAAAKSKRFLGASVGDAQSASAQSEFGGAHQ